MTDDLELPDDPEEEAEPQAQSAVDRGSQKRVRDKAKRAATEGVSFWKSVFADPAGRRELWAILSVAHAFDERFANGPNGSPQSEATWLYAGEQRLGFRLFRSWMKIAPEGVMTMLKEHDPVLQPPPKPKRRRKIPDGYWPVEDE